MGGGLMQLVAYGAQDIYLTGNPQITFFKVVYRRHTNFSIESIEQTFNGTADFGKKVSCTISRNGDLVHKVYLQTKLPAQQYVMNGTLKYSNSSGTSIEGGILRWVNWVGEKLINYAEIEIGGQRIDKHYGEWLHIWNQLSNSASHDEGYQRMIGNITKLTTNRATSDISGTIDEQVLYIPLQFWFCRNPGLALPLIALQYHEVKINVEFEKLSNLLIVSQSANTYDPATQAVTPVGQLNDTSLWVDYIFLDTDERRRFAQLSHEYLIEQLQFPGEETISTKTNKIRLNFNHPVKELVWVVQKKTCSENMQHFNYSDVVDSSPALSHYATGSKILQGVIENIVGTHASSGNVSLKLSSNIDTGRNTCDKAKIQLNGQDRFSQRSGDYFNFVQPYNHHTKTPHTGINVYSFALKPEEHQPSGTCNFSRIDNANLFLTVTSNTILTGALKLDITTGILSEDLTNPGVSTNANVRVYAVNYNVLRIMSGMGGLAYSN